MRNQPRKSENTAKSETVFAQSHRSSQNQEERDKAIILKLPCAPASSRDLFQSARALFPGDLD